MMTGSGPNLTDDIGSEWLLFTLRDDGRFTPSNQRFSFSIVHRNLTGEGIRDEIEMLDTLAYDHAKDAHLNLRRTDNRRFYRCSDNCTRPALVPISVRLWAVWMNKIWLHADLYP